jgi:nucleoside-diphosphate-sugar epimerase
MSQQSRVTIIGGTGHIGGALVPMFVRAGWEVCVISRGQRPVPRSEPWRSVRLVQADYRRAVAEGRWGTVLSDVPAGTVIDLLGIDAIATFEAARQRLEHLVLCGSLWMFGPPRTVPTPARRQGTCPFEAYAKRFRQMEQLINAWQKGTPPVTGVMPSNICGPGKVPLDPHGTRNLELHRAMSRGQTVQLPGDGNTLVGPADREDVARVFFLAATQRDLAAGRLFIAAAAHAVPLNHLVQIYADAYGTQIPVEHLDWDTFRQRFDLTDDALYHHQQHMCGDITRTRRLLGYEPAHTVEDSIYRAVRWMYDEGLLEGR